MMDHTIMVIGTIFMDIKGYSRMGYNPVGRNLGNIQFIHGGVGRNIAENLARLGGHAALVSSVDEAGTGHEIIERLRQEGVETRHIQKARQQGMGMWLAILNEYGELAGSISQMPDLSVLQQFIFSHGEEVVRQASHIALEIDLNEELSQRVIELAKIQEKPVYGIPGNMDVILRRPDFLQGMECFICNDIEASRLIGAEVLELQQDDLFQQLARYAAHAGLRSIVVTLGGRGSVFYDAQTHDYGHRDVFPVQVVDSSGAGDAFFSGTVMGLVRGLSLREAVVCGTKVAGWTIESVESNCPDLKERMQRDDVLNALLRN